MQLSINSIYIVYIAALISLTLITSFNKFEIYLKLTLKYHFNKSNNS